MKMSDTRRAEKLMKEVTLFLLNDSIASGKKSTIIGELQKANFYNDYMTVGYTSKLRALKSTCIFTDEEEFKVKEKLVEKLRSQNLYGYQDTIRVTHDIIVEYSDPNWENGLQCTSDTATHRLRQSFKDVTLVDASRVNSK